MNLHLHRFSIPGAWGIEVGTQRSTLNVNFFYPEPFRLLGVSLIITLQWGAGRGMVLHFGRHRLGKSRQFVHFNRW